MPQRPDEISNPSPVILSNRLPFVLIRDESGHLRRRSSSGGVSSVLDALLRRHRGTWVGWPGTVLAENEGMLASGDEAYRIEPINLSLAEVDHYYDGFCNRTLWPLFHSMPAYAHFAPEAWNAYRDVNLRFCSLALEVAERSQLLWVHDYHLLLAPAMIRERSPSQAIAFFLHVPFPSPDMLHLCPWCGDLVQGLLGADLIGFQTERCAENFALCAERMLGVRFDSQRRALRDHGSATEIGVFPIGAEFSRFEAWSEDGAVELGTVRRVLGVDRLDYTKGIIERIRAFERLLEDHPEHHGQVAFLQVAVPTRPHLREYQNLRRHVESEINRVNSRFGSAAWTPIEYRYELLPQHELAKLYRDSEVALVTPISDGMNLVAKEYVACKGRHSGVLILSSLAGAAREMHESLLVHPNDLQGCANALHQALVMDESERATRMDALRRRERLHDARAWALAFLEAAWAIAPGKSRLPSSAEPSAR